MTARVFACALAVAGLVLTPAAAPAAAAPQPVSADDCKRAPGASAPRSTWALNRLELPKLSPITRGRDVQTGDPVRVAVIDSGLDRSHPQLRGLDAAAERSAIPDDPGRRFADCAGHGTQVTAILAAQPSRAHPDFAGVAPDVRVIPIKVVNRSGDEIAVADVVRAIDDAVAAKAQIANLSFTFDVDIPALRAAVGRAQRAGMLIVAAAGNDNQNANKLTPYPAAYATRFDNVIGVAAMTQSNDIAPFSQAGPYVGVAAPGVAVQTVGVAGGYIVQQGTSFATPYVAGVAALVLASHPGISAKQIRDRIEATAEAPPANIPDDQWGYGVVDPYLAVTSVRVEAPAAAPARPRPTPVAAAAPVAASDRSPQHRALAIASGLLGLTAVVITAAAVLRGRSRHRRSLG